VGDRKPVFAAEPRPFGQPGRDPVRVRNNCHVHQAFGTVLWIVCIVGFVVGLAALIVSPKTWEEFRESGLVMDSELPSGPQAGSAAATVERDAEIRELLEARNARRARRGEPPIDVEQELLRLSATAGERVSGVKPEAPQVDPELLGEIRDLVVARNHRRARAGKPPLDVEAEVERELGRLRDL
jgi:hypothetical protein